MTRCLYVMGPAHSGHTLWDRFVLAIHYGTGLFWPYVIGPAHFMEQCQGESCFVGTWERQPSGVLPLLYATLVPSAIACATLPVPYGEPMSNSLVPPMTVFIFSGPEPWPCSGFELLQLLYPCFVMFEERKSQAQISNELWRKEDSNAGDATFLTSSFIMPIADHGTRHENARGAKTEAIRPLLTCNQNCFCPAKRPYRLLLMKLQLCDDNALLLFLLVV